MARRGSEDRPVYPVVVAKNVEAVMRDGAVLRADIARPRMRGKFPVLLTRTPYGKSASVRLASAGYVVIAQDMRGRYASDGEYTPVFVPGYRDAEDGYDSVAWAAGLPFCDGKVGVFGISYPSWASWELASQRPPHLVAMFNGGFGTRLTDWELGGVFRIGRAQQWLFGTLAPDVRRRKGLGPPHTPTEARENFEKDREKALWFVPLKAMPDEFAGGVREVYHYWLDHQHEDLFNFGARHPEVDVPVMHMTGWHDRLVLTVDHFTGMQQNGRTEAARQAQRLVVGPWSHGGDGPRRVGEMDFGRAARVNFTKLMIRWFDHWLKGIDTGVMRTPPVRYFVMGENRWGRATAWPPEAKPVAYFLRSGGSANTPAGDGGLSQEAPAREAGDRYDYDPRDPVMTLFYANAQDAPLDQGRLAGRRDVLVYQTPLLRRPVRIAGRPEVRLFAASSARDTDFIVKLIDVHPEGFAHQVCYGIVRARVRESFARPKLLNPGQVYEYRIQMLPAAILFQIGHRIRIDVTSSDFPNFDRNHNTGGDDYGEATFKVARQEVFHDAKRPSRVILPVML